VPRCDWEATEHPDAKLNDGPGYPRVRGLSRLRLVRNSGVCDHLSLTVATTDVSFKLQDRLTVLRIRLFAASDLTVAVFQALLRDAVLPGLLDLELEITSNIHFVYRRRPPFVPFSKDSAAPSKGSILAPAVAAGLEKLQIGFEEGTVVEDSRAFLDLFGAKPSVLKIEGDGLLLRTGRP
jgi:hypothetical protein